MAAHSLLDDEGEELADLQQLWPDQRLYVCSSPDEPFLRNRPKRCQLFRVAHAQQAATPAAWTSLPAAQDAAIAGWHEGKVVAVPNTMADLRAVAAERLGLADEVGSIRFRSAGSGLLIFETAAVADDDLLLVETPTPTTTAADVRSLLLGAPACSTRLAGEALDTLADVRPPVSSRAGRAVPAAASSGMVQHRQSGGHQERRLAARRREDEKWAGRARRGGDDPYGYGGKPRPSAARGASAPRARQQQLRRPRRRSSSSSSSSSYSTSSFSPLHGGDDSYSSTSG